MITMFSSTTLCTCETIFIGIEGKIVMLCYLYDEIQNNKKKNNKIGIIITTYNAMIEFVINQCYVHNFTYMLNHIASCWKGEYCLLLCCAGVPFHSIPF